MADREIDIKIRTSADTQGVDATQQGLESIRQGAGQTAESVEQTADALRDVQTEANAAAEAMREVAAPGAAEGGGKDLLVQIEALRQEGDAQADALAKASLAGEELVNNLESQSKVVNRLRLNYAAYSASLGDAHVANQTLQGAAASTGEVLEDIDSDLVSLAEGYRNGTVSAEQAGAALQRYAADLAAQRESVGEATAALAGMQQIQAGVNQAIANREAEDAKKEALRALNDEYDDLKRGIESQIEAIETEKAATEAQIGQAEKLMGGVERGTEAWRVYGSALAHAKERYVNLTAAQDKQLVALGELKRKAEDLKKSYDGTASGAEGLREGMSALSADLENVGKNTEKLQARYQSCTTVQDAMHRAQQILSRRISGLIASMVRGQLSARAFAIAVRGLGAALYTALGPLGLALAAIAALVEAMKALWGWYKDNQQAAEESAQKQIEALNKESEAAKDAKKAYEELADKQRIKRVENYLTTKQKDNEEDLMETLKKQTSELREQVRLKNRQLDDESRRNEAAFDLQEEQLRAQAAREGWASEKLDAAMRELEYRRSIAKLEIEAKKNIEEQKVAQEELNNAKLHQQNVDKQTRNLQGILRTTNDDKIKNLPGRLERMLEAQEALRKSKEFNMSSLISIVEKWNKTKVTDGIGNGISDEEERILASTLSNNGYEVSRKDIQKDPRKVYNRFLEFVEKKKKEQSRLSDEAHDPEMLRILRSAGQGQLLDKIYAGEEIKNRQQYVTFMQKLTDEVVSSKKQQKEADEKVKELERKVDDLSHQNSVIEETKTNRSTLQAAKEETIRAEAERAENERLETHKNKDLAVMTDKELSARRKKYQEDLEAAPVEEQTRREKNQSKIDAIDKEQKKRSKAKVKAQEAIPDDVYKLMRSLEDEIEKKSKKGEDATMQRKALKELALIVKDGKISSKKDAKGRSEYDIIHMVVDALGKQTGIGDQVASATGNLGRAMEAYNKAAAQDRQSIVLVGDMSKRAYDMAVKAHNNSVQLASKIKVYTGSKH